MMYKQYAKKDECYYIIVRFTYEGIPSMMTRWDSPMAPAAPQWGRWMVRIPRLQWLGQSVTCCWSRTASPMRGLVPEYA